jgi:protein gp37
LTKYKAHESGFDSILVGGESANGTVDFMPMNGQWARNIRDLCKEQKISFFFSHLAGEARYPSRILKDVEHNEVPPLLPRPQE